MAVLIFHCDKSICQNTRTSFWGWLVIKKIIIIISHQKEIYSITLFYQKVPLRSTPVMAHLSIKLPHLQLSLKKNHPTQSFYEGQNYAREAKLVSFPGCKQASWCCKSGHVWYSLEGLLEPPSDGIFATSAKIHFSAL